MSMSNATEVDCPACGGIGYAEYESTTEDCTTCQGAGAVSLFEYREYVDWVESHADQPAFLVVGSATYDAATDSLT